MEFKFLILTPNNYDIKTLLHTIETINDNIVISNKFINDITYKDIENNDRYYYLDNNTINTSIKNNVVIYATSNINVISGITIDDFYNSNILTMSFSEFNNISTNFLLKHIFNINSPFVNKKSRSTAPTFSLRIFALY